MARATGMVTTHDPLINPPSLQDHTGFIMAEDQAILNYLSHLKIPPYGASKEYTSVGVWFRWPEGERQIAYPFITIDLLSVEPRFDLFHSEHRESLRGLYIPSKSPELPTPSSPLLGYNVRNYLPMQLVYQVMVSTRTALHDRYLRSIFMTDIFPPRPFWITVEADSTVRRTEVLGSSSQSSLDTTESATKRSFRQIYTISMMAEIPQDRLDEALNYLALRSVITVSDKDSLEEYFRINTTGVDINPIPIAP